MEVYRQKQNPVEAEIAENSQHDIRAVTATAVVIGNKFDGS